MPTKPIFNRSTPLTPPTPPSEYGADRNTPAAFRKAMKQARHARNAKKKQRYSHTADSDDY